MQRVLAEEDLTGMEVLVENWWSLCSICPLWCTVIETLTLKLPRVCHLPCLHRDTWYVFTPTVPSRRVFSLVAPWHLHFLSCTCPVFWWFQGSTTPTIGTHMIRVENTRKKPEKTWKKPYVQRAVLFEAGAGKPPFFFEEIAIESAPPLPSSSLPWSLGTVSPGASCHTICYPKEVYFGSWNTEDCLLPTNTAEASRRLNVLFLCSRFTAVQSTALFASFKTLWEHLWKRNQKSMKRGSAHALTRRLWSRLQAISLKLKWNRKDFLDSHGRWEVFQHPSYFGECLHLYIKHISSKVGFFLSQSASSLVKWFSPCLYLFLAKLSLSIIKMVVFCWKWLWAPQGLIMITLWLPGRHTTNGL